MQRALTARPALATRIGAIVVLAGAATVALGCGSNDSTGNAKIDQFAGVWKYTESAGTATCSADGQLRTFDFVGSHKTIAPGSMSDLVDLSIGCDYRYNVKDKVATILPNQICDLGQGDSETSAAITWTLTSATVMEETMTAIDNIVSAALGTCNVSEQGRLTKIADN
jgi:hypothetical protein